MKNIGIIVGSLRQASYSRKLAHEFMQLLPETVDAHIIEIGELPLYNEDWEADVPEAVGAFREALASVDALVFVTPEYNRSIPGGLKNAIDVGSRPPGQSQWLKKPAAIISCSPGAYGAFGANHHLRQSLMFHDMPLVQQPEVYLSGIDKAWDETGVFSDRTKGLLIRLKDALLQMMQKNEES